MTTIAGIKVNKKKMEEACQNFELDMIQIHNLYELILREISNKSTKKAYKELYNKTYLRNIEDKEKNFEEEVNSIKINMGTVINSNYWRIEGIKNVYNVFQEEVTEKFDKDLSEFKLEESESESKENLPVIEEENYYDEDDYDDEYEEDYDEDYDDEYEEDYDEDYDDEYEKDEYEDDYYEDEDDEYEEDYDDDYDDDYIKNQTENKKANKKETNKKNSKKKQNIKEEVQEIDDDAWEKEIIQQLNKKRTAKNTSKKQNTNLFGKLFKDMKENNKRKK